MPVFEYKSTIPVDPWELFQYHARPGAFDRLVPPWDDVETVSVVGGLHDGGLRTMKVRKGPISITWVAEHHALPSGLGFKDIQLKGPFAKWEHSHRFESHNKGALLHDYVEYAPPGGPLGALANMKPALNKMFAYRHKRTHSDLVRHAAVQHIRPDRVVFAGVVGDFERQIAAFLSVGGVEVFLLQLQQMKDGRERFVMAPFFGGPTTHPLDGADAVIHTGRPHGNPDDEFDLRWGHIEFLCRAVPTLGDPPPLLLHLAGHRPSLDRYTKDPVLEPALSRVAGDPEKEMREEQMDRLSEHFERVVTLHFGDRIRPPYHNMVNLLLRLETFLFLAGGAKTPSFRWISADDAEAAVLHLLCHDGISGDVAAIAPQPATRAELQEILVKRSLGAYTFNRMLRVLPWAKPGRPAGLDPLLEQMKSIGDTGFSHHTPKLADAVADALGDAVIQ